MSTTNAVGNPSIEHLEPEGSALHTENGYEEAYRIFSQLIKNDPKDSSLWSNRAATCIAMKRYMDGAGDAEQAVKLDPTSFRAWSWLGTARHHLNLWPQSIDALKSALECFPTNRQLTDEEEGHRSRCETGLKKAQDALALSQTRNWNPHTLEELPWTKAFALEEELLKAERERYQASCGFILLEAYKNWDKGMRILQQQEQRIVDGKVCVIGKTGALEALSNAILCDPRILHEPMQDFFDLYQRQVIIENTHFNAWQSEGPRVIREQALRRLEKSGWKDVEPALSITIRTWILRGFFQVKLENVLGEWLEMAVEMLEWGRRIWKDVPEEQRGVIFDDSFLLGVRRLFLLGLVRSLGFIRRGDIVPDNKLQKIDEVANLILDEACDSESTISVFSSERDIDLGRWSGYLAYVEGEAQAAIAWCEMRRAHRKVVPIEKRLTHYEKAALYYRCAAGSFPQDDEMRLVYRIASLESLWYSRAPLSQTLPLAQKIAPLVPNIRRIWGASPLFVQMLDYVEEAADFVEEAQKALSDGSCTLKTVIYPESVGEAFNN